ncbi:hypothetical protein ACHAXH_003564 [Discostella pseudostelligera]
MEHFRHSPARKELVSFVAAMGRGLTTSTSTSVDGSVDDPKLKHGGYRPELPLENLSPALASLHGSLSCISATWMDPNQDGIPPDHTVKARFGNPAFRTWHARLVERSYGIVRCLMDCHKKHSMSGSDGEVIDESTTLKILTECSEQGYRAASNDGPTLWQHPDESSSNTTSKQEEIICELQAYLHDSFGHPIRIDYGTGHESSFVVFLLSLCKIGCFVWRQSKEGDYKSPGNPPSEVIGLASLSLFHAYLKVTRGLQRDYMLEPAGSHGVWGLDDYHCISFYLGACQMVAREQWQQQNRVHSKKGSPNAQDGASETGSDSNNDEDADNKIPDNPYLPDSASHVLDPCASTDTHTDNHDHWTPSIIHNAQILETYSPTYLYLSCVQFIRQIKPNVPFFESSPMLNDISHLGSWSKASTGLLRLYEGEVLDKKPVVQHFVFGKIFSASWTPSRTAPLEAPTRTFVNGPMGEECIAPWAYSGGEDSRQLPPPQNYPGGMPPTRAPWAK